MLKAMVLVVEQPVPVMLEGLKTQEEFEGRPEQAKESVPVYTDCVMVKL
jgi:hypothetical protein